MRVLLTHVVMGRGGDAVQWTSLAEGFRGAGHTVVTLGAAGIAAYRGLGVRAQARGLARRLPWWARDGVELVLSGAALARLRWRGPAAVDLVVHRAGPYDLVGVRLARWFAAPLVVYLDSHLPVERAYRGERYWRSLHARAAAGLGTAARVCVTPSRALADHYAALGVPSGKIVVRPNGVHSRHLALGASARPPFARPGECRVGFVGSLSEWHRVDLLLEALALLRGRPAAPACHLIVVGTGRQEDRLRALAARLGVADAVEWRGALDHDRAVAAMADFDVAVLPSTLPTGAPMKLYEYAAMARPIVAPALPNIADLLEDGREAVLVDPTPQALAAAIAGLAADPARARALGQAARRRAAGVTWEETARLIVRLAGAEIAGHLEGSGHRDSGRLDAAGRPDSRGHLDKGVDHAAGRSGARPQEARG